MTESGQPTTIGDMRWLVSLATRQDTPTGDSDVEEVITEIAPVHAEIKPINLLAFIGQEQIESPITHRITFRWQPFGDLSMFNVILRRIVLPDGSARTEYYRIRRIEEFQGRHRFIIADCELEKATR